MIYKRAQPIVTYLNLNRKPFFFLANLALGYSRFYGYAEKGENIQQVDNVTNLRAEKGALLEGKKVMNEWFSLEFKTQIKRESKEEEMIEVEWKASSIH